jgi:hypothetical protein
MDYVKEILPYLVCMTCIICNGYVVRVNANTKR